MKEIIKEQYLLLEKQTSLLKKIYHDCHTIGIKACYSEDEFEKFEVLTSRFARSIDFLVRKVYRTIDMYEFENQGTLIDIVNNAHKRGLLEDIDELRMIKDIRNSIVHEYIEEHLIAFFDEVLLYAPKLILLLENAKVYLNDNYKEVLQ
jgi:hypothetical protein